MDKEELRDYMDLYLKYNLSIQVTNDRLDSEKYTVTLLLRGEEINSYDFYVKPPLSTVHFS